MVADHAGYDDQHLYDLIMIWDFNLYIPFTDIEIHRIK